MSEYTPAPHESRARFIAGSINLIQRRDGCTLAEAEETAIGEWERWMEWHNVRVRRGVVAEEPEWEYGQSEVLTDGTIAFGHPVETLEEAIRRRDIDRINYPWPEELGVGRRRKAGEWVPVKQEGAGHEGDS